MVTPRQSAREQMVRDIVRVGRAHLASVRPAELSLRAVARDLDVVPSALYRYVRDREALIALLVADADRELGDTVDAALAAAPRRSHRNRLTAAVLAARAWAAREPSRFALLHGGQTGRPGTRLLRAAAMLAEDAWRAGKLTAVTAPLDKTVRADMEKLRLAHGLTMPVGNVARVYGLWSAIVGAILFDTSGQYPVTDPEAFLRAHITGLAGTIGL
ncbi:TetR/AcrR family transcriptional regulator [Crossiella sp. CA-258035]|uniref:TetR/AcrR family transcriptional regulator n=1 Tax=Crossiella sp. CA-258035 TaxID=2981138 RepID=UPI0024BD4BA0|nr:TetR/AcrR family transcriptional regulator [Crossiella sp. CA-258035]WHT16383.1 TetR/AcrR family transcriptional regulator [Crossiella sp. CA-258035]